METLWQDVKYGFRTLLRSPGFTAVAVLTLALGIGANTAIFSLVHAVLLRPLPFDEPERLVTLWEQRPQSSREALLPPSGHEFDAWRQQGRAFDGMTLYIGSAVNLTGSGEPESLRALRVSAEFFSVLRASPLLGRAFTAGEDRAGHDRVVILSAGLWRRRFAANPGIVGQEITLNDAAYTVIGVMPHMPESLTPDLWLPMNVPGELLKVGRHSYWVMARLKPGVTIEQAQDDAEAISLELQKKLPTENTGHHARVVALREALVGETRHALLLLLAAVGFVLLIACVNVANLLLTRSTGRQKEMAVRAALGAGRARLTSQLLVESTLLATVGGAAGLLLAAWMVDLLPRIPALKIQLIETARIDAAALGMGFAISLLTGIGTGLVPALRCSQPRLAQWLGEGSRMSGDRGRRGLRSALVASEVALALILLVGAGLMMKSFFRLVSVDPGFNPRNVATVTVDLPGSRYEQATRRREFTEQLLQRIQSLPGVEGAGATSNLPLSGGDNWMAFSIEGRPAPPPGQQPYAPFRVVTPDYFRTLRIPLRSGRFFSEADARLSVPVIRWYPGQPAPPEFDKPQPPPVALISEGMARRYWPNEDPIGKQIRVLFSPPVTIVGVVADIKHNALNGPAYPHVYFSYQQEPWGDLTFVVRTTARPSQYAAALREQVRALDPNLPVAVSAMDAVLSGSVAQEQFYALLVGAFGALALGLAVVGIFGVVSYSAAQRTTEIGVRMALGAQRKDILRLVIGQGMTPILVGVVIGVGGALGLTRWMERLLFEVQPSDPATFAGVCILLPAVALLACYVPAQRASRVDPMVALRHE